MTSTKPEDPLARIQIKTYYKAYMTGRKATYRYQAYYLYLPRRVAEPLIGRDLRITTVGSGILIEPSSKSTNCDRSEHPSARLVE